VLQLGKLALAIRVDQLNVPSVAEKRQDPVTLPTHIPQFDGMRAFAILAVMCLHASTYTSRVFHLDRVFAFGWAGVDLFFVLSGFLITGILLDAKTTPRYFRNFYARRALRIWPLYYSVLIFFFVLLPIAFKTGHLAQATHKWPIYAAYLQNVLLRDMGYGPLAHTWSLAIEEQFYLVWPLFVFLFTRKGLRNILLATLVVSLLLRLAGNNLGWGFHFVYTFPLCRFDSIAMGGLTAYWVRSPECSRLKLRRTGLAAILIGFPGLTASLILERQYAFVFSFFGLFFTGCLILSLVYDCSILRLGALRYVGKVSYGLYLFHLPIFRLTEVLSQNWKISPAGSVAFEFFASFIVASTSWYVFERPLLRLKRRFRCA